MTIAAFLSSAVGRTYVTICHDIAMNGIGVIVTSRLSSWACDLLASGYDSRSTRVLAGVADSSDCHEIETLFKKVQQELSIPLLSEQATLRYLLKYYAQDIVDGSISPSEGASRIYTQIVLPLNYPQSLSNWVYLDDGYSPTDYHEMPEQQRLRAIIDEAHDLLKQLESPTFPLLYKPPVEKNEPPNAKRHSWLRNLIGK